MVGLGVSLGRVRQGMCRYTPDVPLCRQVSFGLGDEAGPVISIRVGAEPEQAESGIVRACWPEVTRVVAERWRGGAVQLPDAFTGGRVVRPRRGRVNCHDVLGSVPVGEADAGLMREVAGLQAVPGCRDPA